MPPVVVAPEYAPDASAARVNAVLLVIDSTVKNGLALIETRAPTLSSVV